MDNRKLLWVKVASKAITQFFPLMLLLYIFVFQSDPGIVKEKGYILLMLVNLLRTPIN